MGASHAISVPNPKVFNVGGSRSSPSSHPFSQLEEDNESEEYMLDTLRGCSPREK
jgi:hypothetical protein